jgi:hypothetical protein
MVATITPSPEHIPSWVREVECFDPLITVIMDGTNGGFTALDVNSVVINPIGHIFGGTPGGVFRSMNDADQWSNVSS